MSRRPTTRRFLLFGFVALATLATACGTDGPATESAPAGTAPEGGAEVLAPAADGPEPEQGDDAPPEPVALTASFRGVSATTIKVGVVAVDLESVRAFVDLDHGSYEAAYRALIDVVNADGGINGRRIEMTFGDYLPIGTEAMDTVCARLTQDEEVFVVLGSLLNDGPLCYTALNDTALIGSIQNDRRLERSTAPWFTGSRNSDDVIEVILRGFDREGVFGGVTVAVVAALADQREVEDRALPLLRQLGIEPVNVSFIEASPIDRPAAEGEVQVISERQESAGADLVLAVGGGVAQYVAGLENTSYRPRIATTSLGSLRALIRDAAAGAALGEFHIPGLGDGFYDADTPDGGAPVFFYEWVAELEDLRTDGTTL
jgi:hypothetical protein